MKKTIRILHVVTTMDYGGVETLLMEIYRNIDRNKIQFDFLCHNSSEGKYVEEIKTLGGYIYETKSILRSGGVKKYKRSLISFFKQHPEYQIIHCHKNVQNGIILKAAADAEIPVRISHSHIANRNYNCFAEYYYRYSMREIKRETTDYFACSLDAAKHLYQDESIVDKTLIIKNSIDIEKFKFSNQSRNIIRDNLNAKNDFIIVHVGRFMEQKNHNYIIDIFSEIVKKRNNSRLWLIGDGVLQPQIQERVLSLGISEKVEFIGSVNNVHDYLSASDVFLFPSLFEGLGIVLIEAQANGLPCVISKDVIPEEVDVGANLITRLSLNQSKKEWASACLNFTRRVDSEIAQQAVRDAGYDIKETAHKLQNFYLLRQQQIDYEN